MIVLAAIAGINLSNPIHLFVSHHVALKNQLLFAREFRRDGSLVGSQGWMSPNDGLELPLIIVKSRAVRINESRSNYSRRVIGTVSKDRFKVQGDDYFKYQIATLRNGEFVLEGNQIKLKPFTGTTRVKSNPTEDLPKIFPAPSGVDTGIEAVYWSKYRGGYQLGAVEFGIYVESMWRAALKDPTGKIRPLEACVNGLKGYIVRGIQYIDPKGWIVVDATVAPKEGHEVGATTNFGNQIFWIEAKEAAR